MTSSSPASRNPSTWPTPSKKCWCRPADFGVEFGRATGGIFNVVTKSGTNSFHGTSLWRYQSQRFDSVSNFDRLNQIPKSVFSHNVYGFTLGGPVRKDKTFFFAGYQQDTLRSTGNFPLVLPTEEAVTTLRSLFPSNPRLDLYLNFLGSLRGTANPIPVQLGADPDTGMDRGSVQFATAPLALAGIQWRAAVAGAAGSQSLGSAPDSVSLHL